MESLKCCRAILVVLACIGCVWPSNLWADTPVEWMGPGDDRTHTRSIVRDVALGSHNALRGTVLDSQGNSVPRKTIIVSRNGEVIGEAISNDGGRFELRGLRGGLYRLSLDGRSHLCRLWTAKAAPPHSIPEVALVTGEIVRRGQRPFRELFLCDPIVLGAIVAAAIAIPLAVRNSRSAS